MKSEGKTGKRESVRGKLLYYQELIIQNEQKKRKEEELDEEIGDNDIHLRLEGGENENNYSNN